MPSDFVIQTTHSPVIYGNQVETRRPIATIIQVFHY